MINTASCVRDGRSCCCGGAGPGARSASVQTSRIGRSALNSQGQPNPHARRVIVTLGAFGGRLGGVFTLRNNDRLGLARCHRCPTAVCSRDACRVTSRAPSGSALVGAGRSLVHAAQIASRFGCVSAVVRECHPAAADGPLPYRTACEHGIAVPHLGYGIPIERPHGQRCLQPGLSLHGYCRAGRTRSPAQVGQPVDSLAAPPPTCGNTPIWFREGPYAGSLELGLQGRCLGYGSIPPRRPAVTSPQRDELRLAYPSRNPGAGLATCRGAPAHGPG